MKEITCLVSLFFAFNLSADINVEVLNGKTPETICFVYGSPGNPQKIDAIECGTSKIGDVQSQKLDKYSTFHYLAHWTAGKIWTLSGTFVAANGSTVFILIKR